ncbi:MAG: aminotransferase class V-fold PLP-dependent enzyme [Anaerolineales bacterium]|nr:aminotransferase class V-fold PLP-dependent enzyme [Anaerolineales bacterium]
MVNKIREETLDPQDWDAMRSLAHQMVDDAMDNLQNIRQGPVWQPIPQDVKDYLSQPAPWSPEGERQTYQDFKQYVLPHPMGNTHPRFWGWVMGNGIPYAVMADMLAATLNPNMGGGEHVPNYVERQVIDWCKEIVGFPADSSGLLVSGGSMANFVGLSVARNKMAGYDIRTEGVAAAQAPLTVYASTETHSSNHKAVELLGLGKHWLRAIPVNDKYQIDLQALEAALADDISNGHKPVCIIGNAGTVNTGAIDDLNALAEICEREGIWFHVDGAFGALAALSDDLRERVAGLERADSLAFDLHKWMYMPFEAACVLVRDFEDHANTFSEEPDYLSRMPRGPAGGAHPWFGDLGVQLTRGFKALKVWMTIKAYGLGKFARQVEQNVSQARYLADLVEANPHLELLADVPLNIVCFRYNPGGMSEDELDDLNDRLGDAVLRDGRVFAGTTLYEGKVALRPAIVNWRTRPEDIDLFVDVVHELGASIAGKQ